MQPGAVAPLEFENDDVVKFLKFSLAPWALTSNALKFILKRRRNIRGNVRLCLRRAEKHAIFASPCALEKFAKFFRLLTVARKTINIFAGSRAPF